MERFSKNREAILHCLKETTSHPTADWIYRQLKPENASISLGTVYRNLTQLKDAGLIRSMGVVAGEEHFDANVADHPHMVCRKCGCIMDLEDHPSFHKAMEATATASGSRIAELQFYGLCAKCLDE